MTEETLNSDGNASPSNSPVEGNRQAVPRRGFLVQFMAGTIGTLVGLVPLVAGLLFFLDPLVRRKQRKKLSAEDRMTSSVIKDADGFIKMSISADSLPENGIPQSFTVYDDKVDAWNMFLNQPVGTVWLRKTEQNGVMAFSTICPHLGCSVEFRQARQDFYCPCHLSAFELNGEKKNPIPPRGMDTLELKPNTGNEIWIRYREFRGTTKEKIPV